MRGSFVSFFIKQNTSLMEVCSFLLVVLTVSCFCTVRKPIVWVKSTGVFDSIRHLWLTLLLTWLFLMGETDVYSQRCCADGSTKPAHSVPEHQGRKTVLSIHSASGQWAAEWPSSPGSGMPGAAEPYWLPTRTQSNSCRCCWSTY